MPQWMDRYLKSWINDNHSSKLLEKTPVSENAGESENDSNGDLAVIFGAIFYVCFREGYRKATRQLGVMGSRRPAG